MTDITIACIMFFFPVLWLLVGVEQVCVAWAIAVSCFLAEIRSFLPFSGRG